jgi:hypothetical protein
VAGARHAERKSASADQILPQKIRRHCVPLPEYAAGFCERMISGKGIFSMP